MEFTDIYRASRPKTAENTLFSSARGIVSTCYPTKQVNKFKNIWIISSICFDRKIKPEKNHMKKKKTRKIETTWRIKNIILNNQWVNEEIKQHMEMNEHKIPLALNLWDLTKSVLWGKFIAIQVYHKEQEKILRQFKPRSRKRKNTLNFVEGE